MHYDISLQHGACWTDGMAVWEKKSNYAVYCQEVETWKDQNELKQLLWWTSILLVLSQWSQCKKQMGISKLKS